MHIKKQTSFECYRRTKRCLIKFLTFIHMKKLSKKEDNRACWISNSHQLNKVIRSKQYPMPIITDILRQWSGHKFFTKLDNTMQYYTFELDNKSQDSCTIITPFGKYKYLRLQMGLKCSPDIARTIMENVLSENIWTILKQIFIYKNSNDRYKFIWHKFIW